MMKSMPNQKSGTVDRLDISSATRWSGLFGQEAAGWWLDKLTDTQPARHLTWLHKSSGTHQKRAKNARKSFVFKAKTDLTLLPASPKKRRIVQKSLVFKAKKRDFIDLQSQNSPAALRAGGGKFSNHGQNKCQPTWH